jgi:hypothetical protein
MKKLLFLILPAVLIIPSSFTLKRIDYRDGIKKNVCKVLKDDVLVYYVFIDTRETSPWTEFDIQTTIDSIDVARRWLEQQARKNGIKLIIKTDYFIGNPSTTITSNLLDGSVEKTLTSQSLRQGFEKLNKWSDGIARKIGATVDIMEKDGIPPAHKPNSKERLIAHLRDEYKVESVALLLLVNNYYRTDISIPVNTLSSEDVEFAVVSYKYPSEIAHNIMHLFGAADVYLTPYRRTLSKIQYAAMEFPDEIMQDPYGKNISSLVISDYTKYLIGWVDTIDENYVKLLTDKLAGF